MEISTGVAANINIDRDTLYDKRKTQLVGKNQRLQRAYRITVENNSDEATTLEIRESIPVSKNSDIRVELDRSKTTGTYRFDEEQGFVIWSVSLPANATKDLDLYYQIYFSESWQTR